MPVLSPVSAPIRPLTRGPFAVLARLYDGPPITFDFTGGVLPSGASLKRASTGTYFDNLGALQSAAIDTARFDHEFNVGTFLGLLVEPQRTNLVRNSAGVPAGSSRPDFWNITSLANGTVAWTVAASALFNGANEVTAAVTNNDAGAENVNFYPDDGRFGPVLEGQEFVGSLFHKDADNEAFGTTEFAFHCYNDGNYVGAAGDHVLLNATAAWQWDVEKRTQIAGANEVQMRPQIHNIQPASTATKTFALPQFEVGPFRTSPIITTGVIATRAADVLHLDLPEAEFAIEVVTPGGSYTGTASAGSGGWDFVWPPEAVAAGERHVRSITASAP